MKMVPPAHFGGMCLRGVPVNLDDNGTVEVMPADLDEFFSHGFLIHQPTPFPDGDDAATIGFLEHELAAAVADRDDALKRILVLEAQVLERNGQLDLVNGALRDLHTGKVLPNCAAKRPKTKGKAA